MTKPELLVTPASIEEIKPLIEAGADAFLIGEERFGLRLAGEFSREQVKQVIAQAHQAGKKVYVAMNAIFHNDIADQLNDYVLFVKEAGADAIVFGDPAVLMAVREVAPGFPLHWSPETIATNYYTANYWGKKGSTRAVLARELSMDAIIETKENADVQIEVQVHGMTCMFQSKRPLLGHYFEYMDKKMELQKQQGSKSLLLHDAERSNKYPIYEDANGTHIMSPNDMCIIDELLEMVEAGIDSFKIDGVLQTPEYRIETAKLYRKAIDLCVEDEEQYEEEKKHLLEAAQALQQKHRPLDSGFFFKETVY